ncbi:MAG TPA: LamG domain-containing protein [Mycobacteriales bacterium]
MTFGFPRRRPSAKSLGILALVAVVLFVLVGLLGKAGSGSGGGSGGGAAPPATGPAPTRGPQGPEQAGEWTFDEGAGRAAADTAGGHPLALLAGASWDADGKDATAVRFDGTRGYSETSRPVLDTAGSYSVAAWVRLDRVPDGFATAVSQDGGRDSAFALQYVPSGQWAMGGPGGRALSEDPPVRGTWTHLAGVRDATTGQWVLYVDGRRQVPAAPSPGSGSASAPAPSGPAGSGSPGSGSGGSGSAGGDAPAPGSTSGSAGSGAEPTASAPVVDGPLAIGRSRSAGRATAFFPGAVDGVHVYAGALRDEDVQNLYQSGR